MMVQMAGGSELSSSASGVTGTSSATVSGFQDGPAVVSSPRCVSSRAHTSQAHGS